MRVPTRRDSWQVRSTAGTGCRVENLLSENRYTNSRVRVAIEALSQILKRSSIGNRGNIVKVGVVSGSTANDIFG